jgi:hypothetical protein
MTIRNRPGSGGILIDFVLPRLMEINAEDAEAQRRRGFLFLKARFIGRWNRLPFFIVCKYRLTSRDGGNAIGLLGTILASGTT